MLYQAQSRVPLCTVQLPESRSETKGFWLISINGISRS
jgi:hypothetical protein